MKVTSSHALNYSNKKRWEAVNCSSCFGSVLILAMMHRYSELQSENLKTENLAIPAKGRCYKMLKICRKEIGAKAAPSQKDSLHRTKEAHGYTYFPPHASTPPTLLQVTNVLRVAKVAINHSTNKTNVKTQKTLSEGRTIHHYGSRTDLKHR